MTLLFEGSNAFIVGLKHNAHSVDAYTDNVCINLQCNVGFATNGVCVLHFRRAVFELDFTNIKAPFGFYRVQLTAAPAKPDNKLVGLKGAVEFKVVTAVTIDAVDLGVSDKDASNPKAER